MFLDLIDHLASSNKFVPSILLIQSLSQLTYFLHLFILILLLTYSHTPPFSLLHCLVFLINMLLLKLYPVIQSQINHSLLRKFFVKRQSVPNSKPFIAALKPTKIKTIFKNQSKLAAKLISVSKRSLYRSLINQHSK